MDQTIRLGSRPSKLALIQAEMVKSQLLKQFPKLNIQIIPIATQGDQDQISSLRQLGGKGVFIKSLEQALIKREIDAAVHSFKDITAQIEEQTQLTAFLKPEAIEDCLILANKQNISDLNSLPEGSIIATSSMRRQLLLSTYYPHLKTKEIRGNVETRIKKCQEGYADAVMLSKAGVIRLGLENDISETLQAKHFLPAPGQGVIAIQSHKDDVCNHYLEAISHPDQSIISRLEFLFLESVGLDCNYPLGLLISVHEKKVNISIKWASTDMSSLQEHVSECMLNEADEYVRHCAEIIKKSL